MLFRCEEVPVNEQAMPCRFGCKTAIGRFSVPEGCACFPDDTEQDLCPQHVISAEPLGDMQPILIYQPELLHCIRK